MTHVCGPCQAKHTQCAYSSDPSVSKFTALKSEYEQLKSSYGNLSTVYARLKHGSALEMSELLEQNRSDQRMRDLACWKIGAYFTGRSMIFSWEIIRLDL
jgi:hypothetical protein